MPRPTRPALLLVPVAVLGAVALAGSSITGRAHDAAEAEALRLAAHAATLGQLELETRTRELEARAAAAASLNAVRALAAHRVDNRTLRDAFETEDWWRGFRDEFPVQLLLLGAERHEFGKKELGRALKTDSLVAEAVKHSPASAVLRVDDTVLLAGAARWTSRSTPVVARRWWCSRSHSPPRICARVAGRTRGAVAITGADHRLLEMAGPVEEEQRLRELIARRLPVMEGATAGGGSVSLGDGLSLWAYADARLASEAARRPAQTVVVVLWLLGLAACAGLVVASFRRREPRAPPEETQHALERARDERARSTPPRTSCAGREKSERFSRRPRTSSAGPAPSWTGSGPPCRPPGMWIRFPSPRPCSPTRLPTQFGRYQLLHVLGQGGMATVHLAVSHGAEGFRRYFVVKRLREDVALMPQVVHQFINEARLGASLVHSKNRPDLRLRPGRERVLPGAGVHPGTRPEPPGSPGTTARRSRSSVAGGVPPRARDPRRARLRPLAHGPLGEAAGHRAPGHFPDERHGEPARRGQAPRLRDRALRPPGRHHDRGRAGEGQRAVHVPGTGTGSSNRCSVRPVLARPHPVLLPRGEPLYQQDGSDYELLVRAAQGPGPLEEARISSLPAHAAELLRTALRVDPAERFQTADEFLLALPAAELFGGAAALLEAVERLVGPDLASEESRFGNLGAAVEDTPASERTTEPGKTVVQFAVPPVETQR